MKTSPLTFTVTASGSCFGVGICCPFASGRSTGMPTCRSGAATMKIISSTSITSTIGVTLISLIGALRPRRRRPRPPPPPIFTLAPMCSGPHVDLTRYDRGELVGKGVQTLRDRRRIGGKFVVEDDGGNGGHQTERRCEQCFGDAR